MSTDDPIFHDAIRRLDRAAQFAEIDSEAVERLKYPQQVLEVAIPVRMDDGTLQIFTGYRIVAVSDSRGGIFKPEGFDVPSLIHRVGRPRIDKVALYLRRKRVVLSDFVIGVQCETVDDARCLQKLIQDDEQRYKQLYSGTCAPYTTVKRVTLFLKRLGCHASVS